MDDKNFDHQLKDIFENPPEFHPDAEAISDIHRRLDAAQGARRRFAWWWLLLPLIALPFLFSTVFFYQKYQNLEQQILDMQVQLTNTNTPAETSRETITLYDTIYQTIIKNTIVQQKVVEAKQSYTPNYRFTNSGAIPSFWSATFSQTPVDPLAESTRERNWTARTTLSDDSGSWLKASSPWRRHIKPGLANSAVEGVDRPPVSFNPLLGEIPLRFNALTVPLPYREFTHPDQLMDELPAKARPRPNPLLYAVPTGLQVGAYISPLGIVESGGQEGTPLTYGLNAEVEFAQSFRLQLGLELLNVAFTIKDEAAFPNFPVIQPDNPGDFLEERKASLSYWQIPISFKYLFRKGKQWQPTLSVGTVAQRPFRQEFTYEFLTNNSEYKRAVTLKNGDFSLRNFRSAIGLEYHFPHFTAATEVFYQHDFEQQSGEYLKLRYLGWRLGLRYHLY